MTQYNIFEGLTKINEDFSITPLLADKWEFLARRKTLTFILKPNIKFHDGEPFSSKDVKFSFERFGAKDSTNKDKAFFASIESIETPDPQTVVLNFKDPSYWALVSPWSWIPPSSSTRKARRTKQPPRSAPVPISSPHGRRAPRSPSTSGTTTGTRRKIAIAHATFRFISDPSAASAGMMAGDVDAFPRFANLDALGQFKSDPRFQVLIGGTECKTVVGMNNKRKPLDDVRVRQAIAYAIDRSAVIGGAMNGLGTPIGSHYTPNWSPAISI